MQFKMDYGVLQMRDVYPNAGGMSTEDLTNPTNDTYLDNKQQEYLGETTRQKSPMVFVFAAVIFLLVVSMFQK